VLQQRLEAAVSPILDQLHSLSASVEEGWVARENGVDMRINDDAAAASQNLALISRRRSPGQWTSPLRRLSSPDTGSHAPPIQSAGSTRAHPPAHPAATDTTPEDTHRRPASGAQSD